ERRHWLAQFRRRLPAGRPVAGCGCLHHLAGSRRGLRRCAAPRRRRFCSRHLLHRALECLTPARTLLPVPAGGLLSTPRRRALRACRRTLALLPGLRVLAAARRRRRVVQVRTQTARLLPPVPRNENATRPPCPARRAQ